MQNPKKQHIVYVTILIDSAKMQKQKLWKTEWILTTFTGIKRVSFIQMLLIKPK